MLSLVEHKGRSMRHPVRLKLNNQLAYTTQDIFVANISRYNYKHLVEKLIEDVKVFYIIFCVIFNRKVQKSMN